MRVLVAVATFLDVLSGIFVLVGICSFNWFNVSYTTSDPLLNNMPVVVSSTFSIYGVVQYDLNIGPNNTYMQLNHWAGITDCFGDNCLGVTYNANLECYQLANITGSSLEPQTTQNFRSWYLGAACTYPKPTIAMITLCLISLSVAIPFTGLCAVDLAIPIIPLIMNGIAWLWLFLAVCIYGGGVSSHARGAYWTDDNAMVLVSGLTLFPNPNGASFGLGYAYGLPCTAMFLVLISVALLALEWRKDPTAGEVSRQQEMTKV